MSEQKTTSYDWFWKLCQLKTEMDNSKQKNAVLKIALQCSLAMNAVLIALIFLITTFAK